MTLNVSEEIRKKWDREEQELRDLMVFAEMYLEGALLDFIGKDEFLEKLHLLGDRLKAFEAHTMGAQMLKDQTIQVYEKALQSVRTGHLPFMH
jgi:hypothetical protein